MKVNKIFFYNQKGIILFIWTMVIFVLTLFPLPNIPSSGISYFDKIVHLILFGEFSYLLFINSWEKYQKKKSIILSMAVTAVFSGLIELLQNFSPGRSCGWEDFVAGTAGAGLFLLLIYFRYE